MSSPHSFPEVPCEEVFASSSERHARLSQIFSGRTLVLTPDYPEPNDLYLCAFVHTRSQGYRSAGLDFDVAVCNPGITGVAPYFFEGVDVCRLSLHDLRDVLQSHSYETILVHFMCLEYLHVFECCDLSHTQLLVFSHGATTLYWDSPEYTTPYFSARRNITQTERERYLENDKMLARLDGMPNLKWIFVSNFVAERSRELTGLSFQRAEVIPNYVDMDTFGYSEKDPDLRKRIFCVRRFEDYNNYSLDTVVRTILELSRRACFSDMEFSLFGSGPMHEKLVAPLRQFGNVHVEERFLTHEEIAREHGRHGIALFPTRFDAQGASMCEAASSGLAVVSTRRDSVADFLPDDIGLLADVDDYVEYADVIERLYNDPSYFLECSRACHEKAVQKCGFGPTIGREIALIRREQERCNGCEPPVAPSASAGRPLLTVIVLGASSVDHPFDAVFDSETRSRLEVIHARSVAEGIGRARGRFLKVIFGDDGFDSAGLSSLLEILAADDTCEGITLLSDCAEYPGGTTEPLFSGHFDFLIPGNTYPFSDLQWPGYGFEGPGPDRYSAVFPIAGARRAVSLIPQEEPAGVVSAVRSVLASDRFAYLPETVCRRGAYDSLPERDACEAGVDSGALARLVATVARLGGIPEYKLARICDHILAPAVNLMYGQLVDAGDAAAALGFDEAVHASPRIYDHPAVTNATLAFHRRTSFRFVGRPGVVAAARKAYQLTNH